MKNEPQARVPFTGMQATDHEGKVYIHAIIRLAQSPIDNDIPLFHTLGKGAHFRYEMPAGDPIRESGKLEANKFIGIIILAEEATPDSFPRIAGFGRDLEHRLHGPNYEMIEGEDIDLIARMRSELVANGSISQPTIVIASDASPPPISTSPAPSFDPAPNSLNLASQELEETGYFNPPNNEVACKRVMRAIAQRLGQSDFRDQLLAAYQEKCVVTDCSVLAVLEAAHIKPFCEEQTFLVSNGLLLRSDIHTLFDRYLMGINPDDFTVTFAEPARRGKYKKLEGKPLRDPINEGSKPSQDLLRERWQEFCARTGRTI